MVGYLDEDQLSQQRKEVVNKITTWFHDEGYVIETIANDKSYYHATVHYVTPGGQKTSRIFIDIPKDSRDKINIGTVFGYKLLEKPSYFSSDANNANRFAAAFCDALEPLNVSYKMDEAVEDIDITTWKPIYFDGLSKHVLFETTGDVLAAYRSLRLVHRQISKKSDT